MKAIDLGLSVYWGENLLETPSKHYEERLFTWGDDSYNYVNKKRFADYIDNEELLKEGIIEDSGYLSPQYDHASKILGDQWRMPTVEEFNELINKCRWIWAENGYFVVGPNNNFIKIPYVASIRDSGERIIEDVWYLGEIEKPIMYREIKCFWSSEPSYDMTTEGMTNEAFALCLYGPESCVDSRISSVHRSNKNLIIPVTSEKTFLKENEYTPLQTHAKKPSFIDMGNIGFDDDDTLDVVPPPIISKGTDFPLPLWSKLPEKIKSFLNDQWGISNESKYNKLLNDAEEVIVLVHALKNYGLI